MRERSDVHCLHEPFMYDYYLNPNRVRPTRDMPYFEPDPGHPQDFASIAKKILTLAETTPVFFKDMSYYITPYLETQPDFFTRIINTFLIRDPAASIASYYALDNAVTLEEIGYEAQWTQVETLTANNINCQVLETETIQTNPVEEITAWWKRLGLSTIEQAFSWSDKTPGDWKQVETWHESTLSNTSIRIRQASDSVREKEKYRNAASEAPHLDEFLAHHTQYYCKLKQLAISN